MPRITIDKKLERIRIQQEKLKEQQKKLEREIQLNIGKAVIKEWDIQDHELAIEVIIELKEKALEIIQNKYSETESNLQINNS